MKEAVVELKDNVKEDQYRAWYRCLNCGLVFQYDMKRGCPVSEMDGECPMCGCRSGSMRSGATVGIFPIVKYNPEYDKQPRYYFR